MKINQIINEDQTINYDTLNQLCFLLVENETHDFEQLFQGQIEQYRKILNIFLQLHKDTIIEESTQMTMHINDKFYSDNYPILLYYLNRQLLKGNELERIVWTILESDNPYEKTESLGLDSLIEILKQKEPLHPDILEDIYEKCTRKQMYYEEKEQIIYHFPYDYRYYFLKRDDVRPTLKNKIMASYQEKELTSVIKQLQFDFFEDAEEKGILFQKEDKEIDVWSKIYQDPTLCREFTLLETLKTKRRRTKELRKNVKALIKTMYYR